MSDVLDKIVASTRQRIGKAKTLMSVADLESMAAFERSTNSLAEALQQSPMNIIAEVKKASPSAGTLENGISPDEIARSYAVAGASAISILTEPEFFSGSLDDLANARKSVDIPILRKDFIVDPYQLVEARAYGADAVLLIARILDRKQLSELRAAADELDLDVLVELYDEAEIEKLDLDQVKIIGANNRDLSTMTVDINRSVTILGNVPDDKVKVSESGVRTSAQLEILLENDIHSVLIGESLMLADDPQTFLKNLLSVNSPSRQPS